VSCYTLLSGFRLPSCCPQKEPRPFPISQSLDFLTGNDRAPQLDFGFNAPTGTSSLDLFPPVCKTGLCKENHPPDTSTNTQTRRHPTTKTTHPHDQRCHKEGKGARIENYIVRRHKRTSSSKLIRRGSTALQPFYFFLSARWERLGLQSGEGEPSSFAKPPVAIVVQ